MGLIQSTAKSSFTGSGNKTINTGTNFTSGNQVFLVVEFFAGSSTDLTGVTCAGNAMSQVIGSQFNGTTTQCSIWWIASNPGGSDAIVMTFGAGGHDGFASVLEFDNVTGEHTGPLHSDDLNGAGTSSTATATGATTSTPVLLLGVSSSASSGTDTYTQPAGWTGLGTESNGATNNAGATAYLIDTGATGTKSVTFTKTDSGAGSAACIAIFLISLGGNLAWIRA